MHRSTRSHYQSLLSPSMRVLSPDQCEEIHLATLEVLERTGVWLDDEDALEALRGAGARIKDLPGDKAHHSDRRVLIPSFLVEEALKPREGGMSSTAADALSYFGTTRGLEACAELARSAQDTEVKTRALRGFEIAMGKARFRWVYPPRDPPAWALPMTTVEAGRLAVPLLERLSQDENLKYGAETILGQARQLLANESPK